MTSRKERAASIIEEVNDLYAIDGYVNYIRPTFSFEYSSFVHNFQGIRFLCTLVEVQRDERESYIIFYVWNKIARHWYRLNYVGNYFYFGSIASDKDKMDILENGLTRVIKAWTAIDTLFSTYDRLNWEGESDASEPKSPKRLYKEITMPDKENESKTRLVVVLS